MGDKWTFGRFYMILKSLLAKINPKVSRIMTTHFCPMSIFSLVPYVMGKMKRKAYYKRQAKLQTDPAPSLNLTTGRIRYTSGEWFEGFVQTYLSEKI